MRLKIDTYYIDSSTKSKIEDMNLEDMNLEDMKTLISDYRYCFAKMVGQKESYWMECEYCKAEVYEYNPEPRFEMTNCEYCGIQSCPKCLNLNNWSKDEWGGNYCKNCYNLEIK